MITHALGHFEKINFRTIWQSEAASFTPWLGEAENSSILGDGGLDKALRNCIRTLQPIEQPYAEEAVA